MRVAILFSGGKDSNYALFQILKKHKVECLISMISKNKESYMFQTEGLNFIDFQAECLEIPLLKFKTKGEKEKELIELKEAIKLAKKKYKIEGIVSGAIESTYQSTRIQKICNELDLWCINPIWQIDEKEYLEELIKNNFKIKIISIASYPLNKEYLEKNFTQILINKLLKLNKSYKISPIGEGGEFETFVLDSPIFKKKINIIETNIIMDSENSGKCEIKKIKLEKK